MKFPKIKGFTLLELLVVIAIMSVIASLSVLSYSKSNKKQIVENGANALLSALEKARSETLGSKSDSRYGVYLSGNQAIIFKGTAYNANDATNEKTDLGSLVTLSSVSLSGGGSSVVFNRLTGETANSGTVVISLIASSSISKTVTIYPTGVAE